MIDFFDSHMALPLEVTVDDREPNRLFLEFKKRGNIILTKKRLVSGDILIDNQLLAERKTVSDFCHSLIQGRLFDQIIRMLKAKTNALVIIEGNDKDLESIGVSPKALQGAIASISIKFKVPILKSVDISQTVEILLQCYNQIEKINAVKIPLVWKKNHKITHTYDPLLIQKLRVFSAFPGLGPDRSLRLIQKFSTLEKLFKASK
ncbi:ERCC4 domain-containing protein [Cecembia sp.]|uniref:ERCC4 domain-containing protein n=1 Tax=Cecembia sp. TaxID=1898110 RepID=UPI0025BF9C13|nr:ERCC4 domain-containing protein [Cecembia sp.]